MPAKTVPGRKAGEDHARSQCPEKHPGTQGCLRQEVMPPSVGRLALRSISGRNAAFCGTQGWQRSCQVAMPASRGSFCWFNVVFSSDQRVLVLKRTTDFQEPVTFGGQSLLRYGQLRYAGKQRPLRKSVVERFATLTREEREKNQSLVK